MTIREFKKMLDSVPEKEMDKPVRFCHEDYFYNSVDFRFLLEDVYYDWNTDSSYSASYLSDKERIDMEKVGEKGDYIILLD